MGKYIIGYNMGYTWENNLIKYMNTPETKNIQLSTIHATKSGRLLLTISTSRKFLSLKEISSCNRKFCPVYGNFVRKLPPQIGYFFL